jgi:aryl-phospho-beta-D-glucosidase BglC (GH1 family)
MKRSQWFASRVAAICGLLLLGSMPAAAQQGSSVMAVQRAAHLRHGVNLSEWFAQVYDSRGYTKEHFDAWTTAEDIALIKAMGFDHVRLSVNPQPMFNEKHGFEIAPEPLASLDRALKMILDHGLALVIDLHPEGDFKARLATEDAFVEEFCDFWRALAKHYATTDPERVFFEILNEPELRDRYRWYGIQAKLATAIREGAPQHTIIATGANWSADDELVFLDPLRDPNIIYNFHFYEPHIFTHQGATWGSPYWPHVRGLKYPSDRENTQRVAEEVPEAINRLFVVRYGLDHWDATRIDAEIGQVAQWAKRWNVPVVCNEFGAYRKFADPRDRAAWISDARTSLEMHGMGWTMWDYSGGFGVVTKKDGKAVADEVTVKALGLKTP